ncbi:putative vacuolar protein-sorting-associated protein [Elsinoe australis]|uniref:Putative vacuolar protein-sorting-associated protein n=1 Tax=Elsinoe australis TaxID=40998 RepID=A0A4U7B705_9PEZI|nr:putative vacuolar protein-sorting-associated protein [Elsinoe australis]
MTVVCPNQSVKALQNIWKEAYGIEQHEVVESVGKSGVHHRVRVPKRATSVSRAIVVFLHPPGNDKATFEKLIEYQYFSHSETIESKHQRLRTGNTTMNRLFGARNTAPKPSLNDAIGNVQTRLDSIDVNISKLNAELATYQQKLSRMRDGPGKNAIRSRAKGLLERRRQYEAQKDQLMSQSWNMEQAGMMQDNLRNTMATVDALKTTTKELKKQYGKVDIDKIDKLQDEMADLMDVGNEIQESISRSYDLPEDVDEAELDAELEALGEEVDLGEGLGETGESMPSFLQDSAPPQFIDEPPEQDKVKEAAG